MPIVISAQVFEEARRFFEIRGSEGCEGTAMIMLTKTGRADRLVIPDQRAHPIPHCSVEVTHAGKVELALALGAEDRYVARIHSHPGEAFHSKTDDENPALTNEGALSFVVPYFGLGLRHGPDACALFVRRSGRWKAVSAGRERSELVMVAP